MRPSPPKSLAALLLASMALIAILACKESNSIAGPAGQPAVARLAGTWTGTFQPNSEACAGSTASATFEQDGSMVTGHLSASSCGLTGAFRGTLEGDRLTGHIDMAACAGGAVVGTVTASGLSLTVADLTRPLVTENQVVLYGGVADLHRQTAR